MVLYIAKRSLHDVGSSTHRQALLDIYGEENVIIVDLIQSLAGKYNNYVGYNKPSNILERFKRVLQGNVSVISTDIISKICDLIKTKDVKLIFSEESELGNLMKAVKNVSPNTYIICFYHDIMADLLAQWREKMPGKKLYFRLIECNLSIKQERMSQQYCDENWVFHKFDAEKLYRFYGKEPSAIIPLAAPRPFIPDVIKNQKDDYSACKKMLFVCSKYFVNRLGFKWFYENVLSGLKGEFQINVVGMGSMDLADFCTDRRVKLIGEVDDLAEYYLSADIVITPIFDGGGMKVKTMEAISYAKIIVGTSESLHGFWDKMPDSVRGKIVYQCDTAEGWKAVLNELIESDLHKYNAKLNQVFEKFFSYDALLRQFRECLLNVK